MTRETPDETKTTSCIPITYVSQVFAQKDGFLLVDDFTPFNFDVQVNGVLLRNYCHPINALRFTPGAGDYETLMDPYAKMSLILDIS